VQVLSRLFMSFTLISLGAYGGGLVTIPLIQHELVESMRWLRFDEMAQIIAISQMTPGPIAVNAATLTGFRLDGVIGALVATTAVVLPSVAILALLVPWIDKYRDNGHVRKLRQGIQVGVLSLILFAAWSYGYGAIKTRLDLVIAAVAFLVFIFSERRLHPILIIFLYGIIGAIIF
jgi:chromate transporter